jgi:hypothetical protein
MATMIALRSMQEEGVTYSKGDRFDTSDERAQRLFDLQVVVLAPGEPVPIDTQPDASGDAEHDERAESDVAAEASEEPGPMMPNDRSMPSPPRGNAEPSPSKPSAKKSAKPVKSGKKK